MQTVIKDLETKMASADVYESGEEDRLTSEVRKEPEINKLFRMVMKHEGSDLHLKVGLPPHWLDDRSR